MIRARGTSVSIAILIASFAAFLAAVPAPAGAAEDSTAASDTLRVYRSWLDGRPGYYPPSDPESMSVITGRRESKPVDLPFTGGRSSLAALGRAILAGVASSSTDSLGRLCVTRSEFEDILWLDFPESRPITGLVAEDAWRALSMRLSGGIVGAISEYGGMRLSFVRIVATAGVKEYPNFRLHRGIVLVAKDEAGATYQLSFVRSIAERKGRFKIYSTVD